MAAMRALSLMAWTVLIAACGSAQTAAPPPAAAQGELSPALAPLAWWLGDWDNADGSGSEHWVAAAGAIYGVALAGDQFEVMIVDDGDGPGAPDGVLRFFAMPGGARRVEFRGRERAADSALFANDAHDFPKTVRYARRGDGLRATLGGGREVHVDFRRGAARPAPELEAADRAFSAEVGRRGVDGWVAAFDPGGWMLGPAGKVQGAAIGELMRPTLEAGTLAWAPIASGRAGDLGFTVGKATLTAARPPASRRTTYATIWRRQADGSWRVLFDAGRVVQD